MKRLHPVPVLSLVALLAAACTGGPAPAEKSPSPTLSAPQSESTPTPSGPPVRDCPNTHGGVCLGGLSAGTYKTQGFDPALTYVVPDGWSNMEDLSGNFLLLPPGRSIEGVDAGTADYLGVYSGATVSAADCSPRPMPGIGMQPRAIVDALRRRPGLDVTEPREVSVGGLTGFTINIETAKGAKAGCTLPDGNSIIPLIIGTGPADFEHAQVRNLKTRLYVLANGDSNVVVEVSDVSTDQPFVDAESVVLQLQFSQRP